MESLQRAIETTEQIRDGLADEVARARHERVLMRNMDFDGLMERAKARSHFNETTAGLQKALAEALATTGQALALPAITLEALTAHLPDEGEQLGAVLAEVRALASALSELDSLNRMLGQRTLSYVRAHLAVLSPKPAAYDRRGGASADPRASTVVRVA